VSSRVSAPNAADLVRRQLVAAILEADGGPPSSEDWEAENMAYDILDTPSGRDLVAEVAAGRKAQAAVLLIVTRHHDSPADVQACNVCKAATT
jgi:hypothetical protein